MGRDGINILGKFYIFTLVMLAFLSRAMAASPITSSNTAYSSLSQASPNIWAHRLILLVGLLFVSPIIYFLWKSMRAFSLESIMGGSIRYIYSGSLILSLIIVNRAVIAEFGFSLFEIVIGPANAVILTDLLLVLAIVLYAYGFKVISSMYEERSSQE